jgi:hypothetical protein
MTLNPLAWLDSLALTWRNYRLDYFMKRDPDFNGDQFALKKIEFQENGINFVVNYPGMAIFANEAARLLKDYNAANYLEMIIVPDSILPSRPIVLTVQWRDGKTPGRMVAELKDEVQRLTRIRETQDAAGD